MFIDNHYKKTILFILAAIQPSFSGTIDFMKRGFLHCTGHCEPANIQCYDFIDRQGHYNWCKANCTGENKTNLQTFKDAINLCEKNEYRCYIKKVGQKDITGTPHVANCLKKNKSDYRRYTEILIPASNENSFKVGDIVFIQDSKTLQPFESQQESLEQIQGGHRPDASQLQYAKGNITKIER